ncbi:MAG: sulfatase-like hydrolase/transferase [Phycisphaerales bacterium JB040]
MNLGVLVSAVVIAVTHVGLSCARGQSFVSPPGPVRLSIPDGFNARPAGPASGHVRAPGPAPRPNIVFIMADDLGWGDLGCYGNTQVLTPVLDRLAADGVLFTRYYAGAPVCSPSRAAFVRGRFPAELSVHTAISGVPELNLEKGMPDWLEPTPAFIAKRLQSLGYATALFGKWHLGNADGAPTLNEYGYQEHQTVGTAPEGNPRYPSAAQGLWWRSSDWIADDGIDFVRRHADRPFYLELQFLTPHAPMDPSPEQAAAYSGLIASEQSVHGWTSARHCYYASITAMDAAIGRFLNELDALGLRESTLVVFCSDNGPESQWAHMNDHQAAGHAGPFRGLKRSLYEGGVRVPCIVRWPEAIEAGAVSNATIAAVDWLPTFVGLAGGSAWTLPADLNRDGVLNSGDIDAFVTLFLEGDPSTDFTGDGVLDTTDINGFVEAFLAGDSLADLDGEDIADALTGANAWARTRPIMLEWRFGRFQRDPIFQSSPGAAIVLGNWKLLRNRDGSRLELYDLDSDLMEVNNRADDEPEIARMLEEALLEWQAGLGACVGCEQEGDSVYPGFPEATR